MFKKFAPIPGRIVQRKSFAMLGAVFMMAGLALMPWLPVYAAKSDLVSVRAQDATPKPLNITLGKAELVDVSGQVADVLVADSAIVDVVAVQANRLYVVGLAVGDTNIIALDKNGDVVKRLDIHVSYDLQAIQSLIEGLFPNENVKVGSIHDQVILTGSVSTPEASSKIANVVGHYVSDLQDESNRTIDELISNLVEVRGEQQVMLQVRIVEATRNIISQLGIQTTSTPDPDATDFLSLATGGAIALSEDPAGVIGFIGDTKIGELGTLDIRLNALEEEGMVNVLAEPNLTAVSGEQAGFLAGGEFPVPVGRDQVGNIVIEFREFGVSLNFKPRVLSDKRISLQLETEVSSLDFENSIVLADVTVPGLDVRRTGTTVEIASGGSLMIAGLLQSESVKGMTGLPGIRKTPVLGDLISSDSFERDETELIVIVTPYLVEPYAEEDRAEEVAAYETNPLSTAFASNMRRIFGIKDEEIFNVNGRYGYLLD